MLKAQSFSDGTRAGRKFCVTSTANDKPALASTRDNQRPRRRAAAAQHRDEQQRAERHVAEQVGGYVEAARATAARAVAASAKPPGAGGQRQPLNGYRLA